MGAVGPVVLLWNLRAGVSCIVPPLPPPQGGSAVPRGILDKGDLRQGGSATRGIGQEPGVRNQESENRS